MNEEEKKIVTWLGNAGERVSEAIGRLRRPGQAADARSASSESQGDPDIQLGPVTRDGTEPSGERSDEEQAAWRQARQKQWAAEREQREVRFAARFDARQTAREERLRGLTPDVRAERVRSEEAMARRHMFLPPRDDFERDLYREWAELDADVVADAADAAWADREAEP